MTDLATWLLAQYDADAQDVDEFHDRRACDMYSYDPKWCDCDYPDELRDDLAAKRQIVERHIICEQENRQYRARSEAYDAWVTEIEASGNDPDEAGFVRLHPALPPRKTTPFETDGLRTAVRLLALPYADRDGYRQEWAPSG